MDVMHMTGVIVVFVHAHIANVFAARNDADMPVAGIILRHDVGNFRTLVFSHIAQEHKQQAVFFLHRIGRHARAFWWFSRVFAACWNQRALTLTVVVPAMLRAHDGAIFAFADRQRGTAMDAQVTQAISSPGIIAKKHEVGTQYGYLVGAYR